MTEPSLGDSFEIIPPANGVPRSAWFRARRLSTWHRPYAAALIVLDYLGVALANLTTISLLGDANSKFRSLHPQFTTLVYVVIPLAWLLVLWGNGAYDRRYLGIGTDEFKRVMRTAVTLTATISLLAFLTKTAEELSRLTVALSMLGSLVYVSTLRFAARRVPPPWGGKKFHGGRVPGPTPAGTQRTERRPNCQQSAKRGDHQKSAASAGRQPSPPGRRRTRIRSARTPEATTLE